MKSFFFTILLLFSTLLYGKSPQSELSYPNFNVNSHFFKKNDKNISKIRLEAYFSAENLPKARLKLPEIYNTHPDEVRNNPKYNSQELDRETNFYFYNARYYDPEVCRFVTADNIVDGELSAIGWNRYAYVKGNPVVGKDPTGHTLNGCAIDGMGNGAPTCNTYQNNEEGKKALNKRLNSESFESLKKINNSFLGSVAYAGKKMSGASEREARESLINWSNVEEVAQGVFGGVAVVWNKLRNQNTKATIPESISFNAEVKVTKAEPKQSRAPRSMLDVLAERSVKKAENTDFIMGYGKKKTVNTLDLNHLKNLEKNDRILDANNLPDILEKNSIYKTAGDYFVVTGKNGKPIFDAFISGDKQRIKGFGYNKSPGGITYSEHSDKYKMFRGDVPNSIKRVLEGYFNE